MKTKTAEELAEERKYQKPKQELNHVWNIDYILKCLFVMDERKDWFYFEAYGREFIQNLVDQQVAAATEELRKRIEELEERLKQRDFMIENGLGPKDMLNDI